MTVKTTKTTTKTTAKPKTRITVHRAQADQFDQRWAALSKEGVCDAIGGMEYQRVRREWVEGGRPTAIDDFIRRQANVGPIDQDEVPTDEELASIPLPGSSVRFHTSKDRRSYMDGLVTDFIDNPANDCSEEPQVKVWFTSRVVRGGQPAEISRKLWLTMSSLEVLTPADDPDAD